MYRLCASSCVVVGAGLVLAAGSGAYGQLDPNFPGYQMKVPGVRVGLATNNANAQVWDSDLANWTNPLMMNRVKTTFAFGECFGGGMLSDLKTNAAAAGDDFSGTSASQWNEFATYRGAAGKPSDWVDTYNAASWGLAAPRHDTTASGAWRNDPYGTGAGNLGWEHAQWQENGAGAANKLNDSARDHRYAILWSGSPNGIDWDQLNTAYALLTTPILGYNYDPTKVYILAGQGIADPNVPAGLMGAPNLIPATPGNLQATLGGLAGLNNMDQLFFLANDHGVIDINGMTHIQPKWDQDYEPEWTPEWGNIPQSWIPTPGSGVVLALAGLAAMRRRRA